MKAKWKDAWGEDLSAVCSVARFVFFFFFKHGILIK